jgi:hypothetical protein
MKASAIRLLATSWSGKYFAAAQRSSVAKHNADVSIWNLETELKESEFPALMDFGGSRLAIDSEGSLCVATAFNLDGIACYSAKTGETVWQRGGLKRAQSVQISPSGYEVSCALEEGPTCVLSLHDGRTLRKIHNCKELWNSSFEAIHLIQPADKTELKVRTLEGSTLFEIDRETFALLSAVFGHESLAISESGGPVRCFKTKTGDLLWRYDSPPGSHCLEVGYHSQFRRFLAVEWPSEKGGNKSLLLFSDSGEVEAKVPLGSSSVEAFCLAGSHLLSSEGWLIETATGRLSKQFEFPLKEYPKRC